MEDSIVSQPAIKGAKIQVYAGAPNCLTAILPSNFSLQIAHLDGFPDCIREGPEQAIQKRSERTK
jgi:hypothetical protein